MASLINTQSLIGAARAPGSAAVGEPSFARFLGAPSQVLAQNPMDGLPRTREDLTQYYDNKAMNISHNDASKEILANWTIRSRQPILNSSLTKRSRLTMPR